MTAQTDWFGPGFRSQDLLQFRADHLPDPIIGPAEHLRLKRSADERRQENPSIQCAAGEQSRTENRSQQVQFFAAWYQEAKTTKRFFQTVFRCRRCRDDDGRVANLPEEPG